MVQRRGNLAYATAKSGMLGMANSLSASARKKNLRINCMQALEQYPITLPLLDHHPLFTSCRHGPLPVLNHAGGPLVVVFVSYQQRGEDEDSESSKSTSWLTTATFTTNPLFPTASTTSVTAVGTGDTGP